MSEIIRRIKRNPVLNIFITVAVGQFAHDYLAGAVQWDDIVTYLATLVMGVIARMYVVPIEDHEDLKDHYDILNTEHGRALKAIRNKQEGSL